MREKVSKFSVLPMNGQGYMDQTIGPDNLGKFFLQRIHIHNT